MQTTTFLTVLGAAALMASPLSSSARTDTESEAALRDALRKQVQDYRTQPQSGAEAATSAAPVQPAPATPAPVPKVETVVVPVPAEPAPAPKAETKTTSVQLASGPVFSDVPDEPTAQSQDRALEELRKKLAAEKAKQATAAPVAASSGAATTTKPVTTAAAPVKPTAAKPVQPVQSAPAAATQISPLLAGMEAPAAPVNSAKQQQLADLLNRYKADQISPQEYQAERAKIMAK